MKLSWLWTFCLCNSDHLHIFCSGFFSYRFTVPGTYYYSSGYVGASILMQGVVKVASREEEDADVSVSVAGVLAKYLPGGEWLRWFLQRKPQSC